MINSNVTIVGNVGKEPALRETAKGKSFWVFSVAVTERIKQDNNEYTDGVTNWYSVSYFGTPTGLTVGTKVVVIGSFIQKEYKTDDGKTGVSNYLNAEIVGIIPKRETATSASWDNTATPLVTQVANATDLLADFDQPF